ncbi:MAG: hypothetical protein RLZZ630_1441 [Bacteroidota bacterium]
MTKPIQSACKGTICIALVLCIHLAHGQGGYKPHPLLSPMWQADVEYLDPSQVGDTTMENGFTGASFTYRLPLFTGKDWLSADGGKPFYAVLAQGSFHARQSQIDFIEPDRILTLGRVAVTGLMAKGLRHLYLANLSLSLPSESFSFNPTRLRIHGSLIWRRLYHNNRVWHTLGVTYTPITGKDLPLPVAGVGVKLGNDDQVQFTFPFNASYTHIFSRKFSLSARLQNMGGYHLLNEDTIHSEDPLVYRFRFPRAGLVARWYTHRHVLLTPEIGLTAFNRVGLDGLKYDQTPAPYFKFSIQVRFGVRPSAAPILDFDPGDSGFDPAYLVE